MLVVQIVFVAVVIRVRMIAAEKTPGRETTTKISAATESMQYSGKRRRRMRRNRHDDAT